MNAGIWHRETAALLLLAAALPIASAWLWFEGIGALLRLALVLVVAGAWHLAFMVARAQAPSFAGALSAFYIAMLAPEGLGMVALLLSISFGVVMAELVFGGWGRNILHPATVTLAFVGFGYPAAPWPELALPLGWAALPAGLLAVLFGVASWRLLAGAVLALLAAHWAMGPLPGGWTAAAVVLVGLAADPVASSVTALGRWLNGALYGALVALFAHGWPGAAPVQAAVAAALLASLAAPLLDEMALSLWQARRRRRLG